LWRTVPPKIVPLKPRLSSNIDKIGKETIPGDL
jgi:hypothetical protein